MVTTKSSFDSGAVASSLGDRWGDVAELDTYLLFSCDKKEETSRQCALAGDGTFEEDRFIEVGGGVGKKGVKGDIGVSGQRLTIPIRSKDPRDNPTTQGNEYQNTYSQDHFHEGVPIERGVPVGVVGVRALILSWAL